MQTQKIYKKKFQHKVDIGLKEFNKLYKVDINLEEFNKMFNVFGAKHLSKHFLINMLGHNSRLNFSFLKQKNLEPVQQLVLKSLTGKKLILFRQTNISFMEYNKTYKGVRHKLFLPVRGQRTHTNAKTCKKKRY